MLSVAHRVGRMRSPDQNSVCITTLPWEEFGKRSHLQVYVLLGYAGNCLNSLNYVIWRESIRILTSMSLLIQD